jgi:hypothetical protein
MKNSSDLHLQKLEDNHPDQAKPQGNHNLNTIKIRVSGSGFRVKGDPGDVKVRRASHIASQDGKPETTAIVWQCGVVDGGGASCGRILVVLLQVQVQTVSERCRIQRSKGRRLHEAHGEYAQRLHHWTTGSCQTRKGCDLPTSPSPSSKCCPPCTQQLPINRLNAHSHYMCLLSTSHFRSSIKL